VISNIIKGKASEPRRILLYGTHGIGKSTFSAAAPSPVFIQTEDGLNDIDCERFPKAESLSEVLGYLKSIYSEDHSYKTVVIDSADWLERLIWTDVCADQGVKSVESIGYAKGYVFAVDYWRKVLDALAMIRRDRRMSVILVAHAKIERFQNPETEAYDRYAPQLHKQVSALLSQWADEILFATYRVYTKESDEGFNKKRAQGIGTGERIMYTEERPAYIAKNRLGLPPHLPLKWDEYAKHIVSNGQASKPAPVKKKAGAARLKCTRMGRGCQDVFVPRQRECQAEHGSKNLKVVP